MDNWTVSTCIISQVVKPLNRPEVGKIDAMLEVKTLHEKLNHQQKELEYFRQTFQGKSVEMSKSSDEIEKVRILKMCQT